MADPRQVLRPDGSNQIRVVPYQDGIAFIVQDRATLSGIMVPVPVDAAEHIAHQALELVSRCRKRSSGGID